MILIEIKQQGKTPRALRKASTQARRDAFRAVGEHWHEKFRPVHFTHRGARKYGYKPRQGQRTAGEPPTTTSSRRRFASSYTGRKLRKWGHTRPLVYSGESEALTRFLDVRATSKGSRVVMRAPTLNLRSSPSAPNMREELTRITPDERSELIDVLNSAFTERMKAARDAHTTTHGGSA